MLNSVIKIVSEMTGASPEENRRINAHHNFCELTPCRYRDPKTHEIIEKKLWVTRKGLDTLNTYSISTKFLVENIPSYIRCSLKISFLVFVWCICIILKSKMCINICMYCMYIIFIRIEMTVLIEWVNLTLFDRSYSCTGWTVWHHPGVHGRWQLYRAWPRKYSLMGKLLLLAIWCMYFTHILRYMSFFYLLAVIMIV